LSTRHAEILDLYSTARVEDQRRYYKKRRSEFERAHGELLVLSAVLLGATATVSGLTGVDIGGKLVWAVLAAVLPALATALTAYGSLFAFERHAKLYGDAVRNLELIAAPELSGLTAERKAEAAVRMYVEQVEKVFETEQAQWGQLAAERPASGKPD
jgi:hypothetical protein